MTTPFDNASYPSTPPAPNSAPAGYKTPPVPTTTNDNPWTAERIAAMRGGLLELIVRRVVEALVGSFIPSSGPAFEQLANWGDDVKDSIQAIIDHIYKVVTGVLDPGRTIEDFIDKVGDLLSKISPLNLFNAFGVLGADQIGKLPAGAVVATEQNLIAEGAFRDAVTVVPGEGWEWDGAQGRSIGGSVKVTADGEQNELVSNLLPVTATDNIRFRVYVKWAGLSYAGSDPISMGVTGYEYDDLTKTYTEMESFDIASISAPSADSELWEMLEAVYEVPDTDTPDALRMRLKIGQDLNAGVVWWDEASAVKTDLVKDTAVPGVGTILKNAVNGLENLAQSDWTHEDLLNAMFGQNQSTIGLATRVTYLESLQTAGIQASDLFERPAADDLGADWAQTYSGGGGGTWEIVDGHDAGWDESGSGTREVICRFIKPGQAESNGDRQKVVAVLGSKAQIQKGAVGRNYLYGRMSADGLNWIRAEFAANGEVKIARNVGGTITELGSVDIGAGPSSGSTLGLQCGTDTGTRWFEAAINGQVVLTANDTTSNMGVGYRGWGQGARAQGYSVFDIFPPFFHQGQASPGLLNSWAAIDN